MHALVLFIHWLSFSIWLGAQMTFMVFGPAAKRMSLESWANTWITLARVQRALVAPCAAAATVTGVILTMALAQARTDIGTTWLMVMQGFGLAAGILALAIVTPLANRMAVLASRSLDKGEQDPVAERVRRRLALTGTISGVFILVALFFAALKPGG
jgi:putative copper export protein